MNRRLTVGYLGAVAAIAILVTSPAAAGASTARTATTATTAFVRGAHFSPDTAAVDVYLSAFSGGTSTLWLSDVGYGDVSPYRSIDAGVYAVSMRPHGAAATTTAALTWTVNIAAGTAYTAAAVGTNSQLRGILLPDTFATPGAGAGVVRVIQASSQAGHVSVRADNGTVLTSDTAYGSASDYVTVPAGKWTVQATSTTQPALSGQASVSVASASITTVVVLDAAGGGLALRTVLDAAGPGSIPNGSVSAGGGGTAPSVMVGQGVTLDRPTALATVVGLIVLGCVGIALVGAARGRRPA